jgi:hypothetical protein
MGKTITFMLSLINKKSKLFPFNSSLKKKEQITFLLSFLNKKSILIPFSLTKQKEPGMTTGLIA